MITAAPRKFHEYQEEKVVLAGDIVRHPDAQRPSPGMKRWTDNCGEFDPAKANLTNIVLVKRNAPAERGVPNYYAVDGATRVEACNASKQYGPNTPLRAVVMGNGVAPSLKELADVFLIINTHRNRISQGIQLDVAVKAQEPEAIEAARISKQLGPTFHGYVGVWTMLKHGWPVQAALKEFHAIWGADAVPPMNILRALVAIARKPTLLQQFRRRKNVLRKNKPEHWKLKAQMEQFKTFGKRAGIGIYTLRVLLGKGK